jgi:6-phosphogluconolactonase
MLFSGDQIMLTRRKFLVTAAALPYGLKAFAAASPGLVSVYFGTDTDTDDKTSKGVYASLWNPATGTFSTPRLALKSFRPTFLARSGRFVYVLDEFNDTGGVLIACTRKPNGTLHKLNAVTALSPGSAYVATHPSGRAAYVANYAGGSITSYGILPNGRLTEPVAHFQYTGHGPNNARQSTPHAHSTVVSPDGAFLLVNDLGLDMIHIYRIDANDPAKLTPNTPDAWHGAPGSGPRHLVFAPDGRTVYNINEIVSTVDVLQWDAAAGTLTMVGSPVSILPSGFTGTNTAAEILVSPDGRFVYASNRGDDSVVVLRVEQQDHGLTLQQRISAGGKTPRHITLSPDGRWLIAANQNSSNVTVFQRDEATGALSATGNSIAVPHAMFTLFV